MDGICAASSAHWRRESLLSDNRERIAGNKTYQAISHSKRWAEQLRAWAKKLV